MPSAAASGLMRFDSIVYFSMGGFALFFGLFFLVFLWDIPLFVFLCGPITVIPGVIAVTLGVLRWRREHALIEFANWVKSHRRIKMDVMADRIGKSRFETEKLLGEALDSDLVKGVIDRSADEFVSRDVAEPTIFVGRCPECGGDVNRWAYPEEVWTCPYCNQSVATPRRLS